MLFRLLLVTFTVGCLTSACSKKLPKGEIERIPKTTTDEYYEDYYETPPLK